MKKFIGIKIILGLLLGISIMLPLTRIQWEGGLVKGGQTWLIDLGIYSLAGYPELPEENDFSRKFPEVSTVGGETTQIWVSPDYKLLALYFIFLFAISFSITTLLYFAFRDNYRNQFLHYIAFSAMGLGLGGCISFLLWLIVGGWGPPIPFWLGLAGWMIALYLGQKRWNNPRFAPFT